MPKPFSLVVLSTLLCAALPQIANAETVMQKVARSGVLVAGTSSEAIPFAYQNRQGKLVGYSVDMLELIRSQMEKETGKKVQLKLVALPPSDRVKKVADRQVDIVCDFSSFTWARNRQVDFSLVYATTGTQLAVKKSSNLGTPEAFNGKRIGVLPGTTNELAVQRKLPKAKPVYFQTWEQGYQALEKGTIDAFAADSILLEARLAGKINQYNILPDSPLSQEGIACMVPEDNSRFLDTVNYALYRYMQGFVRGEPKSVQIFDRWFGANGAFPLTRDMRDIAVQTMQLVVESREEIPADAK
ncbi:MULTISPECIES: amino acid ABC transporter substrate-binding protein [Leptolyngbya]|uniref:Amino acid ABC transporter substrate-binding protein n=1 Tax=Leptolyngbya boryana CZ1 TaxID=3060204 RepID=A0AA96X041_LEPBY|nr:MULTISPECIES: amino acid ABC transporter substrate-binding protein [Leptolyngbya]MBD1855764.1 amino acid ABC transporter substrate-binding protein [Leptolyngbya sp. FACHB-1624]MBN8564416.1 amino acid ABC transporter substrate-binding protein [Leptolyngbya sp. UWPOB_LEPTO1]MCY6488514.1 amino acid ABC transporter substrate-binding protein [Leptolyngbya sp. GGD]WNZ48870.1 amino acid ABC transporter substrate-binding protein [Leptolyngbya boryana CZ1]